MVRVIFGRLLIAWDGALLLYPSIKGSDAGQFWPCSMTILLEGNLVQ